MIKKTKIIIFIATVAFTGTLALFLFFGPYSWQVTNYKSLGLTNPGYEKIPFQEATATIDGDTLSFDYGMLPEYSEWQFDDNLKVNKNTLLCSLGIDWIESGSRGGVKTGP